jgi:hypothetical protein
MTSGGGRMVSRARALGGSKKLLSVVRERAGPKILGHGDIMRDAPQVRSSTFSSYGRRASERRVSHFIAKVDAHTRVASRMDPKVRSTPNGCVCFHLTSSSRV